MKFAATISSVALLAAAVHAQSSPDPAINTPTGVTTCQPVLLTFSGSHPPFIITVVPGGQAGAQPLESLGTGITGTSYTWNVDVAAGTYIGFHIVDSIGASQDSAPITIIAGTDTSCVGKNSLSSSASASTSAAASSSSAAASTTASTSAAGSSVSSVASTSSVSAASSSVTGVSSTSKASTSAASSAASTSSKAAASTTSSSSSSGAGPTNAAQWGVIALGFVGAAALA